MKLVRRIGRNVDRVARAHGGFLAAEGNFHLTVEKDEGLFEVMAVRTGPPPGGTCMSITQNRSLVSSPATVNSIGVSDQTYMFELFPHPPGQILTRD